ncbi:unnamed protein product [Musa acuminata subsp. burmannicoides]
MPSSPTSKRLAQRLYHALTSLSSPHAFHVLSLFPAQSADASWADRNGRFDWAAAATSPGPPPVSLTSSLSFAARGAQRTRHDRPLRCPHHRASAVRHLPLPQRRRQRQLNLRWPA